MKIFDYKLILLIALTFVIYFMYKELINLNNRVDKIEKNNTNFTSKIEQNVEPKFINFEQPIQQNINKQFEETIPSTNIESNTRLNDILPNDSCSVSTEDEDSEIIEAMNKNNLEEINLEKINEEDAVEIYSNDNVENVSSPETSEDTPVAEIKDVVIKDVDGSIIMSNKNKSSESEDIIDLNEDALNLSASSMSSINDEDINDIMTGNQSIDNIYIEKQSIEKQSIENQTIENQTKLSEKLTEESVKETFNFDELMKNNKLRQLKDLAQQLNIELKDNGRAKTKKQLAEEIVSVKNNQ